MNKIVNKAYYDIDIEYNTNYLIKVLQKKKELNTNEINSIKNCLYNHIGIDDTINNKIIINIDFNNKLHLGILLSLLLHYENEPLEIFYPLQNYGYDKPKKVEKIRKNLALEMIELLEKTK